MSGPAPDEATRRARGRAVVVSLRLPQSAVALLDARCEELRCSRSAYVAEMLAVALSPPRA